MHPTTRIICVLALGVYVQAMDYLMLAITASILLILLSCFRAAGFLRMLKRLRWLIISMIIIYAFNTPGEYVHQWPFQFAPTYEGLYGGGMQVFRIFTILAAVSLLLIATSRENLIAGFYVLLRPLRLFRLDPERFAARLWLTLHYVEQPLYDQPVLTFSERLNRLNDPLSGLQGPGRIEFYTAGFGWPDFVAVCGMLILGIYLS